MKLQWMKDILGDVYTEELDSKVCAALGERFVARQDFNEKNVKLKEAETRVGQLEEQAKTDKAAYEKELAQIKLLSAVDAELTAAGSRNNTAVRAVLADFLTGARIVDGKVTGKVNGESVTLAARIEALKKDAATDFMFSDLRREGWKPGEGGDGGGKSVGGKKPSEMSYAELEAYLAANPDAKLD